MVCYKPLGAWDLGKKSNGKTNISFAKNILYGKGIQLPCGRCLGCRIERARNWSVRLMHEKKSYEATSFITLTYDPLHLPEGETLVKKDFQDFMKRLRERLYRLYKIKIKFYACGEYGDKLSRPHYHAVIYGYDFRKDRKFFKNNKGNKLYTSKELADLWQNKGYVTVGDVTDDSTNYVAGYVNKKFFASKEKQDQYYKGKLPEFNLMSKGLGKNYMLKYQHNIYFDRNGTVIRKAKEIKTPKYYDKIFEQINKERLDIIKNIRIRKAKALQEHNALQYYLDYNNRTSLLIMEGVIDVGYYNALQNKIVEQIYESKQKKNMRNLA